MRKRIPESEKFKITCSYEDLGKTYSLVFSGFVHYWRYPPNFRSDSDWDYMGYNEYDFIEFIYINKVDEVTDEATFLEESEVDPLDFEIFARKLNICFGF